MQSNIRADMSDRWNRFLASTGLRDEARQHFHRLIDAYEAPDRRYHNLPHIRHCLAELNSVRDECPELPAVEACIWFHDVIYEPPRPDNEDRSAQYAIEVLPIMGMERPTAMRVKDLILDTKHTTRPSTLAGQFMVDIDLSGMGQSQERFDQDGRNIRIEYGHVDDVTFNKGRIALFERLLARPAIYFTKPFHDRYESAARANMIKTIERLRKYPNAA